MADLSGDRGGLIPAYNPANQLNPCLRQNVSGKSLVTSIAVTHLAFLKPSLVAVRKRGGKPNGSAISSLAYLVASKFVDAAPSPCPGFRCSHRRSESHELGGGVGADALEERAQVHARPLTDVVPTLRRLGDLRLRISRRQVIRLEDEGGRGRSSMGPANMATNVRDIRSASETWTMPVVQRKCTRRAFWELLNSARRSENWIGFQNSEPEITS
jgi:hypothetical protein